MIRRDKMSIKNMLYYVFLFLLPCMTYAIAHKTALQEKKFKRQASHPINELFLKRWSSYAMSGEPVTRDELMQLFEAARWAPSSDNKQPWGFIYALAGTDDWDRFFNLLAPGNKKWADKAGALIVIISNKNSTTHSFDTGAAWENLALQGADIPRLVIHGIGGFDYDQAAKELKIPANYKVEAMVAIGRQGNPKDLPEYLRKREFPSHRMPLSGCVFEGVFKG